MKGKKECEDKKEFNHVCSSEADLNQTEITVLSKTESTMDLLHIGTKDNVILELNGLGFLIFCFQSYSFEKITLLII